MKKFYALIAALLVGCASRADLMNNNVPITFVSTKSPYDLALCIDRNADDYALGSLHSKIVSVPKMPIEVVIFNGQGGHEGIVDVQSSTTGSVATIYVGGIASISRDSFVKAMTKNCR